MFSPIRGDAKLVLASTGPWTGILDRQIILEARMFISEDWILAYERERTLKSCPKSPDLPMCVHMSSLCVYMYSS